MLQIIRLLLICLFYKNLMFFTLKEGHRVIVTSCIRWIYSIWLPVCMAWARAQ